MEVLAIVAHHVQVALDAIHNVGLTIAMLLFAAILAAAGGIVNTRMRLYGAMVGGMLMNILVKAEGGGYAAALAAMVLATALAFAIGSTPFLIALLRRVRR
jgi:hypothetical protein